MSTTDAMPEVPGLFAGPPQEAYLLAGRCATCGNLFFPRFAEMHRPGCADGLVEEVPLSRQGTVASYTVQRFPPPPPYPVPDPYVPFVLVTVVFDEGLQVPGQLVGAEPEEVRVGDRVETVTDELYTTEEGRIMHTWKFRPFGAQDEAARGAGR